MTDLSPITQAVLDAAWAVADTARDAKVVAAAALRATADQVVPRPPKNWELISCVSSRELEIRNQLLAIADELEGSN